VGNALGRLAPLAEEMEQHPPYVSCILLLEAQALCGEVELQVRVLFLRIVVSHILVDMIHVRAAVIAFERAAEFAVE
jgi:hypothetical protein